MRLLTDPIKRCADGLKARRHSFSFPSALRLQEQRLQPVKRPQHGAIRPVGGEALTFLFTPQTDSDYMLTVAKIMASYKRAE